MKELKINCRDIVIVPTSLHIGDALPKEYKYHSATQQLRKKILKN